MAEVAGAGLSAADVSAMIATAIAGKADASALTGLATTTALSAVAATVPTMAPTAPPGVADVSAAGTNTNQFTGPNHTHASKARKEIKAVTSATSYTWVYPTAFAAGVVPIRNGIAQTAAGVTDLINVQIQGTPTNTQCTFVITRYQQVVASLLGITVLSLPGGGFTGSLHLTAFEP